MLERIVKMHIGITGERVVESSFSGVESALEPHLRLSQKEYDMACKLYMSRDVWALVIPIVTRGW